MPTRNITLIVRAVGARAASRQIEETAGAVGKLGYKAARTGHSIVSMGESMSRVGRSMTTGLTLPIVGIGFAATKMANSFQQSMTRVHTQAGLSTKLTGELSKQILGMKTATQGPTELADAMFHIASVIGTRAGVNTQTQRAKVGMDLLTHSMKLASIGGSDLESTASALSAAYVVQMGDVKNLGQLSGLLNATVGQGNMRMQGLVDALGSGVLPVAKQAGLGLTDVAGALATLTDEGMSASTAGHTLRTSFHFLTSPSDRARKAMDKIGLSTRTLARDLRKGGGRGLLSALTDLRSHLSMDTKGGFTPASDDLLGMIFPTGRGTPLRILLNQLPTFQRKLAAIKRHGTARDLAKSWRDYLKTPGAKMQLAQTRIKQDMTRLGDDILPHVAKWMDKLANIVDKLSQKWEKLSPHTKDTIVKVGAITALIGPAVMAVGALTSAVGSLVWVFGALGGVLGMFTGKLGRGLSSLIPGKVGRGIGKVASPLLSRGSIPEKPLYVWVVNGGGVGGKGKGMLGWAKRLSPFAAEGAAATAASTAAVAAGTVAGLGGLAYGMYQLQKHTTGFDPGPRAQSQGAFKQAMSHGVHVDAQGFPIGPHGGIPTKADVHAANMLTANSKAYANAPGLQIPSNRVIVDNKLYLDGKPVAKVVTKAARKKRSTR